MVRLLKQRRIEPAEYRAQDEQQRIIDSHRVKRCGVCTLEVPEADMTVEDGVEKCPMCVDTYTAEYLAAERAHVAEIQMESAQRLNYPPQFSVLSLNESEPGIVTLITDSAGNALSQTSPLFMPRTVAKTVLLIGVRFTAANITTYASGITNASAPVITPTLITLSLIAAIGVTPGAYGLTMADGVTSVAHEYARILAVR